LQEGFEAKWKEFESGTHQFKDSIPKKIVPVNLYNPHAEPEGDKIKHPGPAHYDIHREFSDNRFKDEDFEPRLNLMQGAKVYSDNNIDRFG